MLTKIIQEKKEFLLHFNATKNDQVILKDLDEHYRVIKITYEKIGKKDEVIESFIEKIEKNFNRYEVIKWKMEKAFNANLFKALNEHFADYKKQLQILISLLTEITRLISGNQH